MLIRFQRQTLPFNEFIALMALLMSLVALSIDAVLPALAIISTDLDIKNHNNQQLIISSLFLGLAIGQLFFGQLSDAIGRRKTMLIGFIVFFISTALVVFSTDLTMMVFSRVMQGFGIAAPRVLSTAIIRDQYEGRAMARVMSFVMMIFILVPMLAPVFGQIILLIANWQAIFISIAVFGLIGLSWFLIRQQETLLESHKTPVSFARFYQALKVIFTTRATVGFTCAAGIISGPFIFYLSSSQQLFQQHYQLAQWFPLYFAALSLAIGISSFINGKKVMKYGMLTMIKIALYIILPASLVFFVVALQFNGLPPLWLATIYMLILFFCLGLLFGNLNALAMEPLGHIAGIGSAIVGSFSTLIAVGYSVLISRLFDGTLYPLMCSYIIAALTVLMIMFWVRCSPSK